MNTVNKLYIILQRAFLTQDVMITDQTHLHEGHPEAQAGAGHYRIVIVSTVFKRLSTVERHRLVYRSLKEVLGKEVHAVSIKTFTPDEYSRSQPGLK